MPGRRQITAELVFTVEIVKNHVSHILPSSPFFRSEHGPGGLGVVPTFPIGWTHGMNRFVVIAFGLEPDIWGTVIGLVLMTAALIVIPFVDRGTGAPTSWRRR